MEVNKKSKEPVERKPNCLQKCGSFFSGGLEKFYYKLGVEIAKRPIITITAVLVASLACTAGLTKFYEVDPSDPIWVDPKSTYTVHKKWVEEKFPSQIRLSFAIAESESNILTPAGIKELLDIHEKLIAIKEDDYTYEQICSKFGRGATERCWSSSILELWDFNRTVINGLSSSDIIFKVNNATKSPVTNADFEVSSYLGGLTKDATGQVTEAKAALFSYYMQGTNASNSQFVTEDEVTKLTEQFELKFVEVVEKHDGPLLKPVHAFTTRSFGDEVGASIFGDVYKLSVGYVLIILYVALILGRFNCVEMRVYLALGGVLAVGLSIAVCFGLSSAFGIGYGPVQSILPFLLLGLGVDDAFVIVQAWNRLTAAQKELPIIEQSGHALKHAGVSITVTSITDIVAFGIGATTVLPALRDFCIYATIGIIAIFVIQATFFSACVVLDEKRRKANRNGCCCCYAHKDDYQPNHCSQRDLQQRFFERFYGPCLIKLPVKITAVVISLALLATGIYGVVFLKQEYDPNSFIPKDSYVKNYFNAYEQFFPDLGVDSGHVYIHDVNYNQEYNKISNLTAALKSETSVDSGSIDSWLEGYADWLNTTNKCPWINNHINSTTKWPKSERSFNILLTPYIYMTAAGRRHISDVKFNETVELGGGNGLLPASVTQSIANNNITNPNLTTPDILDLEADFAGRYIRTSRIGYSYKTLESSSERVEAMDNTRAAVNSFYSSDDVFAFSRSFETWETDKIIQKELYRNLGLALGCVVLLTLLLIADIGTCILVSVCVLSTLVEVGGFMYLWGLTVDTVTCIQLVLAIGLAVDYSAHIGHTFMTVTGTRNERTQKTMADIGPAVFNGGFSTLLAFLLLANSASYVFDVFFRVNLMVVLLGVWNGMVLLPVLLSFMGPSPYLSAREPISASQINAQFPTPKRTDNYALEDEKASLNKQEDTNVDKPHDSGVRETESQPMLVAQKEGNSVGDTKKSLTPPAVAHGNVKDMPDVV